MTNKPLTKSYFHRPLDRQFTYETLVDCLDCAAAETPQKEVLVFRDPEENHNDIARLQYRELSDKSKLLSVALLRLGIQLGLSHGVGILSENSLEYVIAEYGIYRAGAIAVRMHRGVRSGTDVADMIRKAEIVGLFISKDEYELLCAAVPEISDCQTSSEVFEPLRSATVPMLKFVITLDTSSHRQCYSDTPKGTISLSDLMHLAEAVPDSERESKLKDFSRYVTADSIMTTFPTSGSTGAPKNVAYRHQNALTNARYILSAMRLDRPEETRIFADRPMSHIGGGFMVMMAIANHVTTVLLRPSVTVADKNIDFFLRVLREERCTCGVVFPYILCDILSKADLSSIQLESGLVGGQVVTRELMEKGRKVIKKLMNVYGATETLLMAHTDLNDNLEMACCYTGRTVPGIEVKIVDHSGNIVPVNKQGEILARGYTVASGYYKDHAGQSKNAFNEVGWYKTGDLGSLNEDGYLTVHGRAVEMISRATVKLFPKDIENILLTHPQVTAAQVVGVPDPRLGQEICACVIPKTEGVLTSKELQQFMDEKACTGADGLSLVPKYFLFFDQFPLTNTGKTNRMKIVELSCQRLNLS